MAGVGVVRQRDPEHGDRKGQRNTHAVSTRMAYLTRRPLTPVERQQTLPATLHGLTALWRVTSYGVRRRVHW